MTNWELNYDILVFQTNHGSFKLLKGNISCDLKILECCDIFGYLVLSFLCLFELIYCIWLTLKQMAGIFASECCSDGEGQESLSYSKPLQKATAIGKRVRLLSFPAQATNWPPTLCAANVLMARQPPTARAPLCFPCGTCGRWKYRES